MKPNVAKPECAKPKEVKAVSDPLLEEPIISLKVAGPTSEAKSRVQICARTATNSRLFVFTLLVDVVPRHADLLKMMHEKVQTGCCTKSDLLKLRDTFLRG